MLDSARYLGLYKEEVEAAIAYDKEAVRRRGIHAITNFDLSEYIDLLGTFCCTQCHSALAACLDYHFTSVPNRAQDSLYHTLSGA